MNQERIALIGYHPAAYFEGFGRCLEDAGFQVFWVHITRAAAENHRRLAFTPSDRILDTTADFRPALGDTERCRKELSELDSVGGPRIHDIILMDRVLRSKSYPFALCYLNHIQRVLTALFVDNSIELVSSGRDSALQLMSMLVCRKLGIPWVVPTRARIPQEMYMFASGHETAEIVRIRAPTEEDRAWAEEFLRNFALGSKKPALKAAARNFADVIKMAPIHARLFVLLLKDAPLDRNNDYSRYTIRQIIWMYLKRRFNLLLYKAFPPYSAPGGQEFCLYALHTQPESSIDVAGAFFSDQAALITLISRCLPVSHELYVKVHPTDVDGKPRSFYRTLAKLPGVRLINYDVDSRDLIHRASIIFTLTGTIGYEAGLMGKTVVTFANNYYNTMPTVNYCGAPSELPGLIDAVLCAKAPQNLGERLISFLADLRAQCFDGEFNRMYLPARESLTQQDLKLLRHAYELLHARLVPKPQATALLASP
jgi:capsular polysaccharide biosynthesis protein